MTMLWSSRFQKNIRLTVHAKVRMEERRVSLDVLLDLVETGTLKRKDDLHIWLFKAYLERQDNMICTAAVDGDVLIIKTIMTHWQEISP